MWDNTLFVKMTYSLLFLLTLIRLATTSPNLDDNLLPTDEEVLTSLLGPRQGQPEIESSLGLPSDEEAFNTLHSLFTSFGGGGGRTGGNGGSGTQHFVSSSFPEVDARGFHESVFDGVGDFYPRWIRSKRDPFGINSRGFHDDLFHQDLGGFHPMKRSNRWIPLVATPDTDLFDSTTNVYTSQNRRKREATGSGTFLPEDVTLPKETKETLNAPKDKLTEVPNDEKESQENRPKRRLATGSTFHGDTFTGDFGRFSPMKRTTAREAQESSELGLKRGGSSAFHGDLFTSGFGDFGTMKRQDRHEKLVEDMQRIMDTIEHKRRPGESSGFHGDTFSGGFGNFDTMKKRRPGESSGFHGDTFSGDFGNFDTMKKRRPGESSGFHGDTFSGGFGNFDTMKKRRPGESSGFHGDTFSGDFGNFDTMKKRRQGESSGFHGDTFSGGFGDFNVMKKSGSQLLASGLQGDTFHAGFGDFSPMKKRDSESPDDGFVQSKPSLR